MIVMSLLALVGNIATLLVLQRVRSGEAHLQAGTPMSARHVRDDPGIDHLAFHAESEADVNAVFELLTENGYPVNEPPRTYDYSPGYYAVGFDDPDGIRLEVVFDSAMNP